LTAHDTTLPVSNEVVAHILNFFPLISISSFGFYEYNGKSPRIGAKSSLLPNM
jgi:hypothetical protein